MPLIAHSYKNTVLTQYIDFHSRAISTGWLIINLLRDTLEGTINILALVAI